LRLALPALAVLVGLTGCSSGSAPVRARDAGSRHVPADGAFTGSAPPAWLRTASLTGRLATRSGEALAGGTVTLEMVAGQASARTAEASSQKGGTFSFQGLLPGAYRLTCAHPGRAARRRVIWLDPGGRRLPPVLLEPSAVVAGRVVNAAGKPVAGAKIRARPRRGPAAPGLEVVSGEDGAFRLDSLWPGRFRLEATAPGHAPSVISAVTAPARDLKLVMTRLFELRGVISPVPPGGGKVSVHLAGSGIWPQRRATPDSKGAFTFPAVPAGIYDLMASTEQAPWMASPPLTGLQLGPAPPDPVVLEMGQAQAVSGVVMYEDRPVPGAVVVLGAETLSVLRARVQTDERGRFSMPALPHGEYHLGVWAKGFLPIPEQPLTLPATLPLKLPLTRGGTVSGKVLDSAGRGMAGAAIWVVYRRPELKPGSKLPAGGPTGELGVMTGPVPPIPPPGTWAGREGADEAFNSRSSDVSGEEGTFKVAGLWPGRLRIIADKRGHMQVRSPWITLEAEGAAELAPLVLQRASALVGRVLDRRGMPLRAARILATARDGARHLAHSDLQGNYRIDGLAGRITVDLTRVGFLPASHTVQMGEDGARPRVRLDVVMMEARGTVTGFVLDQRRLPVAGVMVEARRRKHAVSGETGRSGRFSLDGVGQGALTLRALREGYLPLVRQGVKAGQQVELRLQPAAALTGQVRDARNGGAVSGYQLVEPTGDAVRLRRLSRGRFRVSGLAPGKVTLAVTAAGYARGQRVVTLPAAWRPGAVSKRGVNIELQRAGTIRGRVIDARRRWVRGAEVSAGGVLGKTNSKGYFKLSGVPEGSQVVKVTAGKKTVTTDPQVVRYGEVRWVRVEVR